MEQIIKTTPEQIEKAQARGMTYADDFRMTNIRQTIDHLDIAKAYSVGMLHGMINKEPQQQQTTQPEAIKPVSVSYGEDGKVNGIEVRTLDMLLRISLHDAEDGKEMTWDDAMAKFADALPDKKQATIICAYLDEINELLKEHGGDILDNFYWTKAESYAGSAWLYIGIYGRLYGNGKRGTGRVRPVLAFPF